MWLLGRLTPDHKTIAEFRRTEGEGLKSVCAGFVSFLREAGLVRGEWVAIDGSKFQAVASGKSVPSIEALQRQVAQYLQSVEQADASDVDAEAVPPATIQAALSKLQAARTAGANRPLSEPEARLMRGQAGPCYNVQTAVDSECGVIVTHQVTDEATDNRSLQPMAEAAQKALAAASLSVVTDAGYSNGEQVQALEKQGIVTYMPVNRAVNNQGDGALFDRSAFEYQAASDSYRCPAGQRLTRKQTHTPDKATIYAAQSSVCATCALKPRCTTSARRFLRRHWYEEALIRLSERTTSAHMRLRRKTVERPFAELKWRIFEKPRFLLRGQRGAGTEMAIAVLVYNLKQALRVLGNGNLIARLSPS
jgi:transposase